jgi:hypothetical protein
MVEYSVVQHLQLYASELVVAAVAIVEVVEDEVI